jgi:hypothetical protein
MKEFTNSPGIIIDRRRFWALIASLGGKLYNTRTIGHVEYDAKLLPNYGLNHQ